MGSRKITTMAMLVSLLTLTAVMLMPSCSAQSGEFGQGSNSTPVDWAAVEADFLRELSPEEVAARWKDMQSKLSDGIRAVLRSVFPKIVAMSQEAKVSSNCSAGILKWIVSLRHLKSWAVKSEFPAQHYLTLS